MALAPSLVRRSMARACSERLNGHCVPRSSKLLSSMATTSSPGAGCAPRCWKRALIESCSRPGSSRANSTAPPAPSATSAATTAMTSRRRIGSAPLRQVAVTGADDDGAVTTQVAHGDAALRDAGQRPVAAVGDVPRRAADGDDRVAGARAEASVVVVAPQRSRRTLLRGRGGARAAGGADGHRAAQDELGEPVGAGRLENLEEAAVERAGLRAAVGQGRR